MYATYYGKVHQTDTEQVFSFPEPLSDERAIVVLSDLNRDSHIYGITYYVKGEDHV